MEEKTCPFCGGSDLIEVGNGLCVCSTCRNRFLDADVVAAPPVIKTDTLTERSEETHQIVDDVKETPTKTRRDGKPSKKIVIFLSVLFYVLIVLTLLLPCCEYRPVEGKIEINVYVNTIHYLIATNFLNPVPLLAMFEAILPVFFYSLGLRLRSKPLRTIGLIFNSVIAFYGMAATISNMFITQTIYSTLFPFNIVFLALASAKIVVSILLVIFLYKRKKTQEA